MMQHGDDKAGKVGKGCGKGLEARGDVAPLRRALAQVEMN